MDDQRFDILAKTLSTSGTRRGFVWLLMALPLGVTAPSFLGGAPTAVANEDDHGSSHRRHRRKAKHRHQTGNNKEHLKGERQGKGKHKGNGKGKGKSCTPRTCPTGPCGSMSDGCGGTLRCGCPANQICVDGACQDCTVNCGAQDPVACGVTLQSQLDLGGTVYACPGRYAGNFSINLADVTLIGAGEGDDPQHDTMLDAQGSGHVVEIGEGLAGGSLPVTLRSLRITGGNADGGGLDAFGGGIVNHPNAVLTMSDCTVTGNTAENAGGGIHNSRFGPGIATVEMTRCTVSFNETTDVGGFGGAGILNSGKMTLTGCRVTNNIAAGVGGGIVNDSVPEVLTLDASHVTNNRAGDTGGIYNSNGTVRLQNGSTVTDNSPPNCSGTITGPGCATP
jgi:hypothetical protein